MDLTKTDVNHSYLDWALNGKTSWWRYAIGVLVSVGVLLFGSALILFPVYLILPAIQDKTAFMQLVNIGLNFLVTLAALWLVVRLLHRRPFWTTGFPVRKVEWWNLGVGIIAKLVVIIAVILVYALTGISQVTFQMPDFRIYLPFALLAAIVILLQTSTEEFVFRGYVAQAVRRFTASPLFILIIPAIVFAVPHMMNIAAFGGNWYAVLPYLVDGLVLGWIAYRTRSLWMSIGIHWTNNLALSVLYSLKKSGEALPSLTPVQMTMPSNATLIGIAIGSSLLMAVCLTWVINRREKSVSA